MTILQEDVPATIESKLTEVKRRISLHENPVELVNNMYGCHPVHSVNLQEAKRRIAGFESPVELVNNIYGCHPDSDGTGYFQRIFSDLG